MPAHRAPRRPTPPRDAPEGAPTPAMVAGQRATFLVLVAVLLSSLPHPWSITSLAAAAVALVLALRAVAGHARAGSWGWAAWHLLAVGFAGYLLLLGGLQALYPGPVKTWTECSRGALTHQAQSRCDAALHDSTPEWFSGVVGSQ